MAYKTNVCVCVDLTVQQTLSGHNNNTITDCRLECTCNNNNNEKHWYDRKCVEMCRNGELFQREAAAKKNIKRINNFDLKNKYNVFK